MIVAVFYFVVAGYASEVGYRCAYGVGECGVNPRVSYGAWGWPRGYGCGGGFSALVAGRPGVLFRGSSSSFRRVPPPIGVEVA